MRKKEFGRSGDGASEKGEGVGRKESFSSLFSPPPSAPYFSHSPSFVPFTFWKRLLRKLAFSGLLKQELKNPDALASYPYPNIDLKLLQHRLKA